MKEKIRTNNFWPKFQVYMSFHEWICFELSAEENAKCPSICLLAHCTRYSPSLNSSKSVHILSFPVIIYDKVTFPSKRQKLGRQEVAPGVFSSHCTLNFRNRLREAGFQCVQVRAFSTGGMAKLPPGQSGI